MKQETKNNFNLWEYLYYRTTQLYSQIEGKAGFADNKNTGAFLVALCIQLNFLTIFFTLSILLFGSEFNNFGKNDMFFFFLGGVFAVILLLCLYIFANKRHEMIFKKYENESPKQRENRKGIVVGYVVLSFVALSVIVFLAQDFI